METYLIQLATAFFGSLGFAMLFNLRNRSLFAGALGGFFTWLTYLIVRNFGDAGIFLSSVIASGLGALYAELLARIFKCPATLFYIPAVVPLISGSSLYYTMSAAVDADWGGVRSYGLETLYFTLGIACGIFLVSGVLYIVRENKHKKSTQ